MLVNVIRILKATFMAGDKAKPLASNTHLVGETSVLAFERKIYRMSQFINKY